MRRMMAAATLAVSLAASLALPAAAAEDENYLITTAADLAALCGAPDNPSAIHMCHGYVVGVNHMHIGLSEVFDLDIYCVPEDVAMTRNEFVAAFANWVEASPDIAGMTARRALLTFAAELFPCSRDVGDG